MSETATPRRRPRRLGAQAVILILAASLTFLEFLADNPRGAGGALVLTAGIVALGRGSRSATGGASGSAVTLVAFALIERLGEALAFLGAAIWLAEREEPGVAYGVSLAALLGALTLSYMVERVRASAGEEFARPLRWVGTEVRLAIVGVGAIVGLLLPALVLVAVLSNGAVLLTLARLRGALAAPRA